jgi:hypothetical protein
VANTILESSQVNPEQLWNLFNGNKNSISSIELKKKIKKMPLLLGDDLISHFIKTNFNFDSKINKYEFIIIFNRYLLTRQFLDLPKLSIKRQENNSPRINEQNLLYIKTFFQYIQSKK